MEVIFSEKVKIKYNRDFYSAYSVCPLRLRDVRENKIRRNCSDCCYSYKRNKNTPMCMLGLFRRVLIGVVGEFKFISQGEI